MMKIHINCSWNLFLILGLFLSYVLNLFSVELDEKSYNYFYFSLVFLENTITLFISLIAAIIQRLLRKPNEKSSFNNHSINKWKGIGLVLLCGVFTLFTILTLWVFAQDLFRLTYTFSTFQFCLTHFLFIWIYNLPFQRHYFVGYNIFIIFFIISSLLYSLSFFIFVNMATQIPFMFLALLISMLSIPSRQITEKYLFDTNFISPYVLLCCEITFGLAFSLILFEVVPTQLNLLAIIKELEELSIINKNQIFVVLLFISSQILENLCRILLNSYANPMMMYIADIIPGAYCFLANYQPFNRSTIITQAEYGFTYFFFAIHSMFDIFGKMLITEIIVIDYFGLAPQVEKNLRQINQEEFLLFKNKQTHND